MNANKKIINQIIRNVVQQNSIPDGTIPSAEASFALNKYLDDPNTVDLVYINLIERIRNEKSNYEQVLSRILKLIKNNIAIHPPSYQILLELDIFFLSLAPQCSLIIQKTLTYIRALIAHQVKQNPTYEKSLKLNNDSQNSNNNQSNNGHKRNNSSTIGFLRYRSQSASNSSGTNRDGELLQFQRSSLDLSNLLANSVSSATSSATSSSSSSPVSLNESPLKNTLNNSSSLNSTHLSPTLSSAHHHHQDSNNNNNSNINTTVISSNIVQSNIVQNLISPSSSNSSSPSGSNLNINQDINNNKLLQPNNNNNINNNNNNNLSNSVNQLSGSSNILGSSSGLKESTSSMSSINGSSPSFFTEGYIRDLMSIKASTKSSIKAQSLLTSSPFGGLNQSEIKSNKDIFKCPDDSKNWARINIVRESKKKIEKRDATIYTFRRRKPALFQYKYYKDQEPLKITEQEIAQVVRVIINPATPQDRSIATKIFIKIILDIYCKDGLVVQSSEKLISSYFHQFISSANRDTRAHTFNILFNLSIHINLYSELKLEDSNNSNSGTTTMIRDLQESVFRILVEMVQRLVDYKEKDERTWSEALSCILFFITEEGYIIKDKLFQLNSQMIANFLLYIQDLNDSVKRILVRMLTNYLYKDPICNNINYQNNFLNLNEEEFNNVGGINFILQLYTTIRSSESKNNLFVIIFDYVLQTALKTQTIEQSQIINESPLLLELFRKSDASHYFTQIFKCIPEHGFISKFFLYTSEEAKHDSSYSYEDLIIKFTMKLEEFATRYQSIDSNFEKLILDCQEVPERLNQLIIDTLNNGEDDENLLFNAENWLFLLLKKSLIDKESSPQFNFSINTYSQLASNLSARLRRMYISLTERLLLLSKFRLSTSETKTIEIFDMFNDRFSKLIIQGEKSENNLMYIVDILFDMIYKRAGTGILRSKESIPDTNYSLFLSNQFVVSISLLKLFNINIIQYLFNNLQHSENTKEQRLFLLHILIQRCNDEEDLKKVGGISFFKNLLSDLSTQIAYHASYFLLTQLEAESPEEYRTILTRLLSKARENNDENLISNPFFQVQGIIEMTHKASLNNSYHQQQLQLQQQQLQQQQQSQHT